MTEDGGSIVVDLSSTLELADEDVRDELASKPEVVDKKHDLDVSALPIVARKWHQLRDGVAVVADLKSSTQLGLNKHAASTASIYEASTGNIVEIFNTFGADFIAIQGDGAFALFWGNRRRERAICAGITIKTFSEKSLVPRLEKKWETLPETGLKVGVASSPLLVKKVGIPRSTTQEPIWAGRAVNYAAKAAQQADRNQMIVSGTIWDWASKNDYLAVTCACATPVPTLWHDVTIEKIPENDGEREGKCLTSSWCTVHGPEYCSAILAGKKSRPDVANQVMEANRREMQKAIRFKAMRSREDRRARYDGLR